uniref:Uncharacterized protein n=1 Tax=Sphaerodactylus townsendi TaxID=933632 RepID=A0ACB8EFS6_9SAUR
MEKADAPRSVLGESHRKEEEETFMSSKVGTMREFLSGPGLQLVKQEPEEGLHNRSGKSNGKHFSRSVASPKPTGVETEACWSPQPGSETKGFQLSSERATAASQRLMSLGESHKLTEPTALVPPEEREELEEFGQG